MVSVDILSILRESKRGSFIEINDTLQITGEQGFPVGVLDLEKHKQNPITIEDISMGERDFRFHKPNAGIYHRSSTRNFLVQNINSKWLYWRHVLIISQSIAGYDNNQTTSSIARIIKIYDPFYQEQITRNESPEGYSYFK